MNIYRFSSKTAKTILLMCCIALPLFFLPITRDFFDTNKWFLFNMIAIMVLFGWTIRLLTTGNTSISWSGTILGLGLVTAANFFSLTFSSFNKMEAILSPLGPVTWISATIILFFGPTLFSTRDKIILRLSLAGLGGIAGLFALYQHMGMGKMFFPVGSPFSDPFFTPLGGTVGLMTCLLLCLPLSVAIAIHGLKEKKDAIAAVSFVTATIIIVGFGITIWKYAPVASSQILPLNVGFLLARFSWNTIPHILFGVGPEKFFEVFTVSRPQLLNMSPLWNTGFSANASLFLHVASTMGICGIVSFIVFLSQLWKEWSTHPVTKIQAILCILLSLFAPPTLILIFLIVHLLLSSDTQKVITGEIKGVSRYCIALLLLLITLFSLYGLLRWYQGERLIYTSFKAADSGDGSQTFLWQEKAIKTNPMNPAFHMALSQTALSLSESLIATAPIQDDGAPKLSDEEKTLLTNLISRSIQEAKLAVTLSPANVHAWLNLARVYQGLIGIAGQSDTWAIASYQKAMTTDPINPILHLDLGGLYMSLNKYEEAGQEFIKAITLKPNYINGFYNLANAFRKMGDYDNAVKALEQTKSLVAKGLTDEGNIEQEIIAILEEKKVKGTSVQSSSLYVPELRMPQ